MNSTNRSVSFLPAQGTPQISRRSWLHGWGLGTLGWALHPSGPGAAIAPTAPSRALIWLTMVGGASPWETFDPKPDAPATLRGPFGSIATAVPGVRLTEHLPALARRMGHLNLIRSVYHDADPTHDVGLRLLQTVQTPSGSLPFGSMAALQRGAQGLMPPFVVLPNLVGPLDGSTRPEKSLLSSGSAGDPWISGAVPGGRGFGPQRFHQRLRAWSERRCADSSRSASRGSLTMPASQFWDWHAERPRVRDRFGPSEFGRNCWLAGRLVEAGTRVVVVNMATRLAGQTTWDGHGRVPFGTLDSYRQHLLPAFDQGFAGLIDDLRERGLFDSTLVIATGEMGRTPWINESGGRDHWPGVWSAVIAGGGTTGGQVIGSSNAHGTAPHDRPVPVADLMATAAQALGVDLPTSVGSDGRSEWAPIRELWG